MTRSGCLSGRNFNREYGVRYLYFTISLNIRGKQIKEVSIHPRCDGLYFEIEYVYLKELLELELDKDQYLSIDLGLDNFAACISTNGTSIILEGRGIKLFNLGGIKVKLNYNPSTPNKTLKRVENFVTFIENEKTYQHMNKNVHYIIQTCIKNKIGNIVIGELKNIKQNIKLGRKNNQNFVNIPYTKFKQKLKSKCKLYGIRYIETSEVYTSQRCSHCGTLDKTNRKYRGLYVCKKCGTVISAETNAAINILKKLVPEAPLGDSGTVNVSIRIRTHDFKLL